MIKLGYVVAKRDFYLQKSTFTKDKVYMIRKTFDGEDWVVMGNEKKWVTFSTTSLCLFSHLSIVEWFKNKRLLRKHIEENHEKVRFQGKKVHVLKTVEPYFSEVKKGVKLFEVRKHDRMYEVGDLLVLRQYDKETDTYGDDKSQLREITYMLTDSTYVKEGYVILSIKDPKQK